MQWREREWIRVRLFASHKLKQVNPTPLARSLKARGMEDIELIERAERCVHGELKMHAPEAAIILLCAALRRLMSRVDSLEKMMKELI